MGSRRVLHFVIEADTVRGICAANKYPPAMPGMFVYE